MDTTVNINKTVRVIIDHLRAQTVQRRTLRRQLSTLGGFPKNQMREYTGRWWSTMVRSRQGSTLGYYKREKLRPYLLFRRMARVVMMLLKVCRVCRELVLREVTAESWYSMVEGFVEDTGNEKMFNHQATQRKARPFITFVANDNKELIQLTFDKTAFSREHSADYFLTDEIRVMLMVKPSSRTTEQCNELMRFMKRASPAFQQFPLDVQRRLIRCMVYDKYEPNRVITRQGYQADGVYFVLSGNLIEKSQESKNLHELKPGEGFGEEDLKCGCARRNTVVTRTPVEMVSIHRNDYRAIFNMADDSNDPRYLDICKRHIVFQHFPMKRLQENPGVWTVLYYKFGRLMVKDSNDMEWIYIIKSGEARVLKHLRAGVVDMDERRRKINKMMQTQDPYHKTKKMMNFVAERKYLQSAYKIGQYHPKSTARHKSAPAALQGGSRRTGSIVNPRLDTRSLQMDSHRSTTSCGRDTISRRSKRSAEGGSGSNLSGTENGDLQIRSLDSLSSSLQSSPRDAAIREVESVNIVLTNDSGDTVCVESEERLNGEGVHTGSNRKRSQSRISIQDTLACSKRDSKSSSSHYLQTAPGSIRLPRIPKSGVKRTEKANIAKVPPFVQLESLFTGGVFGLRSCLEPEERGPSASLVSGGCEVLQINKKFFMKYADEAVYSLIKFKSKPFPCEEELLDRLDANLQWEEYKQNTVIDFLKLKGKPANSYNLDVPTS